MEKEYKPSFNMYSLSTDSEHILHRIGSDDYTETRRIQVTPNDIDNWEEIAVTDIPPYTKGEYEAKVSELIHERYNADQETSLINNMLEEEPTEKHIAEYKEYQRFRAECKLKAKDAELYRKEEPSQEEEVVEEVPKEVPQDVPQEEVVEEEVGNEDVSQDEVSQDFPQNEVADEEVVEAEDSGLVEENNEDISQEDSSQDEVSQDEVI